MPATSPEEQARADAYLLAEIRRSRFRRLMAALTRGDTDARRALGDAWVPLRRTGATDGEACP